ncbi:uncharacterized protein PV07_11335 [Cladophialophora immunda]|uniref:Uncharacterized protein n=1 Tax=Cladophialophora immunda TaxID=569365 RepID=A0A0D2CHT5_9EURO|nr:uncharacterized protein PV07_11335 [Cladophialophora immunda]KIW23109.1 hypothetical protein PV07_11335 [Cladophialophora immunda]
MGGHRIHRQATYKDYVKRLVEGGYSNLAPLYSFLDSPQHHLNTVFVQYVDIRRDELPNEAVPISRHKVGEKIHEDIPDKTLARVFIVEDLDTDIIETFGLQLAIEPKFFANHISDAFLDPGTTTGRCPHLPSVSHIKSFYCIEYFHPINLDKRTNDRLCCSSNVRRIIDTFHYVVRRADLRDTALDHVAFVRRKFSFYVQREREQWRVLVLTDPSVLDCCRTHSRHGRMTAQHRHQFEKHTSDLDPYNEFHGVWPSYSDVATFHRLDPQANMGFRTPRGPKEEFTVWDFQGGYVEVLQPRRTNEPFPRVGDFGPRWLECLEREGCARRNSKLSPAEDLIYYWTKAARENSVDQPNPARPAAAGIPSRENDVSKTRRFLFDISRHALFIAASECMLIIQALDASADARLWDLRNLDLAESPFKGKTARSLEHYMDDALKLKHILKGQYKQILHVQDFIRSVDMTEPANEVLTRVLPGPFGPPERKHSGKGSRNEVVSADYGLGEDFKHIVKMIENHVKISQETVEDIPSLMGVRDSHYSGSLAQLGFIFLPITVVTGIVSIQNKYGIGGSSFWIFWVVSLAAMVGAVLFTFLPINKLDRFIDTMFMHYRLGYRRTMHVLQERRERRADEEV